MIVRFIENYSGVTLREGDELPIPSKADGDDVFIRNTQWHVHCKEHDHDDNEVRVYLVEVKS